MKKRLFDIIFRFIVGGMSSFRSPEPTSAPEEAKEGGSGAISALLSALSEQGEQKSNSIIVPFSASFEAALSKTSSPEPGVFVECLLTALNTTCEEIKLVVPDSSFETRVELVGEDEGKTYEGSIKWNLDDYSPRVYHIWMDLLKDGFVYRVESGSFIITTRIKQ